MPHHNHILLLERPSSCVVINHGVFHILYNLLVYVLDLPLPRHTLIYGRACEWVRESVESVILHSIIIDKLDHIAFLKLVQQLH